MPQRTNQKKGTILAILGCTITHKDVSVTFGPAHELRPVKKWKKNDSELDADWGDFNVHAIRST